MIGPFNEEKIKQSNSGNVYGEDLDKPIDFKYYLFLLKKHLFILLTFFIITVTLATLFVSKSPDTYTATAQIVVERPTIEKRSDQDTAAQASAWNFSDVYYDTQVQIMLGQAVMLDTVEALNLTSYFNMDDEIAVAQKIRGMLKVARVAETRLFNLSATNQDPNFAADLVNAVTKAYIKKNFENRLFYSKEILTWLPKEDGNEDELITVEVPFGGTKQVSRKELMESLPYFQSDAVLRELKRKKNEVETNLEVELKRYRDKYPTVIKLRSNLKFIEEQIKSEKKRIIDSLRNQAEGMHQLFHARILQPANVPKSPNKSNRSLTVLMIVMIELIGSCLLVFLLDFFDDTIRSVEDMERKEIVLPFLGPISLIKGNKYSNAQKSLSSFHDKKSDIAESFRYLRVAINFSATPELLKNLMVASCLPSEGKSFVSHNLAISLAIDGNKTLLVDCDLRKPVVHNIFQLDNAVGMSNYLTSNLEFNDVLKESFVENLTVVTSGPISPNPGEILGSQRMKDFIKEAHKHYDRVIFDCPPLTGIGDTYVLGSMIGHIILVIASGKTPADLIKRTQSQLDKAGVKVLGTVLNMVDMEKERYGGYYRYYYHTYNKYYSNADKPAEA